MSLGEHEYRTEIECPEGMEKHLPGDEDDWGWVPLLVTGTIQRAEPDVGVMEPYAEDVEVWLDYEDQEVCLTEYIPKKILDTLEEKLVDDFLDVSRDRYEAAQEQRAEAAREDKLLGEG